MTNPKNPAAVALGRRGGRARVPKGPNAAKKFALPAKSFHACSLTGAGLSSAAARKNNARRVILLLTVIQRWFIVKV
jgi:hypothetical protein